MAGRLMELNRPGSLASTQKYYNWKKEVHKRRTACYSKRQMAFAAEYTFLTLQPKGGSLKVNRSRLAFIAKIKPFWLQIR
jgi:hypothetical protein